MKLVLVLVAAACAPSVGADCQDTWLQHGSAELGLRVDYREGCYQGERLINFSRSSRQGLQWHFAGQKAHGFQEVVTYPRQFFLVIPL